VCSYAPRIPDHALVLVRLRAVRLEHASWPLAAALHVLVHLQPYARAPSRVERALICFHLVYPAQIRLRRALYRLCTPWPPDCAASPVRAISFERSHRGWHVSRPVEPLPASSRPGTANPLLDRFRLHPRRLLPPIACRTWTPAQPRSYVHDTRARAPPRAVGREYTTAVVATRRRRGSSRHSAVYARAERRGPSCVCFLTRSPAHTDARLRPEASGHKI
jgi:hypothetical protein